MLSDLGRFAHIYRPAHICRHVHVLNDWYELRVVSFCKLRRQHSCENMYKQKHLFTSVWMCVVCFSVQMLDNNDMVKKLSSGYVIFEKNVENITDRERKTKTFSCMLDYITQWSHMGKTNEIMEPILTDVPFLVKSQNETYIKVCSWKWGGKRIEGTSKKHHHHHTGIQKHWSPNWCWRELVECQTGMTRRLQHKLIHTN